MTTRKCKHPSCPNRTRRLDGWCSDCAFLVGTREPSTDAGEARDLLDQLYRQGWTRDAIATQTGLTTKALCAIRHGKTTTAQPRTITLLRSLIDTDPIEHIDLRPAWPYMRRLRALQAAGHPQEDIAARAGLSTSMLSKITLGKAQDVTRRTAQAIERAWRDLAGQPVAGPPTKLAARMMWEPPMGWDDIDDPDEQHPAPLLYIPLSAGERRHARTILDTYPARSWPYEIGRESLVDIARGKRNASHPATIDLLYAESERIRTARRDRAGERRAAA